MFHGYCNSTKYTNYIFVIILFKKFNRNDVECSTYIIYLSFIYDKIIVD